MKKFNGTDYDGLLPLAYNALNSQQLDGKTFNEIQNLFTSTDLYLYTGVYVGTGKTGTDNAVSLTFPFEPIVLFMPQILEQTLYAQALLTSITTENYSNSPWLNSLKIKKSTDGKTFFWYASEASYQYNISGRTYHYLAIGGYDMGGINEWVIIQTETWTVPKTGRYMLELYGGGGAGASVNPRGASCQSYDSISLIKGEKINATIGIGGYAYSGLVSDGGSTTFGSYSVAGATSSIGYGTYGKGAGNKGVTPTSLNTPVYSTGTLGKYYGYGVSGEYGGPRAVYLKYLGA